VCRAASAVIACPSASAASRPTDDTIPVAWDDTGVERLRRLARHARTDLVIVAMLAATLLAPVAVPVTLIVRWMRRDDHRIEHVVAAPNVRLLVPRDDRVASV
jgi:hypothetical protein